MNSLYHRASFITSAADLHGTPPDLGAEIAFAGRSNVGKSSAINTITQQKALARVSKTPGRTQLLNFFQLDEHRRLVDLPGYGYADVPGAVQRQWGQLVESYLSRRESLRGVFLLMDIRHPLMPFDRQMIEWCCHCELPMHIALTKSDKLGRGAAMATLQQVSRALASEYGIAASLQLFSSLKRAGVDEAHAALDRWFDGAEQA